MTAKKEAKTKTVLVRFRNDHQDKDDKYKAGQPYKVDQSRANKWFENGVCDPA